MNRSESKKKAERKGGRDVVRGQSVREGINSAAERREGIHVMPGHEQKKTEGKKEEKNTGEKRVRLTDKKGENITALSVGKAENTRHSR